MYYYITRSFFVKLDYEKSEICKKNDQDDKKIPSLAMQDLS